MSTGSNKQWEAITLSSICSTAKNIKWNEERDDREYRYIDLTSVDRVSHTIVSPQVINKSNAPSRAQKIVVTNDVLFATTRPTLRRYCLIGSDFNNQICSTGYCVIRPNQTRILPSWIYYLLTSDAFYNYIEPLQTGATYPAVTDKDVLKYAVPLPSLSEQQRIVGILDAEFEKIDALKANAEQNLQNAKDLFQTALKKELEPKDGWTTKHLNEFASYSIGLTYKPTDVSDNGVVVLRSSNIQNDSLALDDIVRVSCKIKDELFVDEGDILMCSRNGSARLVGKVAMIGKEKERMTYGTFMTVIKSEYNPILLYYFRSKVFRAQISKGENTMINQITKYMLNDVVVSLPTDTNEINRIANVLDALKEQCKTLQDNYTQTIALCNDLKQALLRKAFSGEL